MKMRVWVAWIALMLPLQALANNSVPDPYTTVKQTTDQLLAQLVKIKPLYNTDPDKFYAEVKKTLLPFIDFDGFARGVMARFYRRATPKQRSEFAEKFKNELIRTYAGTLVKYDHQKIEVEPLKQPPQDGRATVDLKIHSDDGSILPVEYSLVLIDGKWKVLNVVINGINIGLQFREQFANYMEQYHDNIDKVIDNWDVHAKSS